MEYSLFLLLITVNAFLHSLTITFRHSLICVTVVCNYDTHVHVLDTTPWLRYI
jgi:hypothetical protein